jgi:hypothetical protein
MVYLKSTKDLISEYVEDSFQFVPPFGRRVKMPYWSIPVEFMKKSFFPELAKQTFEYAKATKK